MVIAVIPTYNERSNVRLLIPRLHQLLPELTVWVVDDNSPDGTAEEVRIMQKTHPFLTLLSRSGKEGLGKAYIHAFTEILSRGEADKVVTMDADLSHNPEFLVRMLEESKNYDYVIGSRYVPGGRTENWELWRRLLSRCGNWYCHAVTGMPVQDCTSGFGVIAASMLKRIDFSLLDFSGYAFLIQMKYLLWKAGASFKEVPIVFKNRIGGESKISSHIISEGLLAPWKLRWKHDRNLLSLRRS